MNVEGSFLAPDDDQLFERPGRALPRRIEEVLTRSAGRRPPEAEELVSILRDQLVSIRGRPGLKLLCVEVLDGDGMSWSAEAVRREFTKHQSHFARVCFSQRIRSGPLPSIAQLVGASFFYRKAVRHKLIRKTGHRVVFGPLLFLLAFACAMLPVALELLAKAATPNPASGLHGVVTNPILDLVAVACGALAIVCKHVLTKILAATDSRDPDQWLTDVLAQRASSDYIAFRNELAERLRSQDYARWIIVDDWNTLDAISKDVLLRYLEESMESAASTAECWVVFERRSSSELARWATSSESRVARLDTRLYRQLPLSVSERNELAELCERGPDAAEFLTVSGVCHNDTKGDRRIESRLSDWRKVNPRDPQRYGPLELLHLLSITAKPGELLLADRFIDKILSRKGKVQSGKSADVLHSLLLSFLHGTSSTKGEIAMRLAQLRKAFPDLIETHSATSLRVLPEVAAVLEGNFRSLGLPEPEVGHLIWVYAWFEARRPPGAFWARKLAYHLLRCDLSPLHAMEPGTYVIGLLHERYLEVSASCLLGCVFSSVPELLDKANTLYDGTPPAHALKAFISHGWNAYSVLGDEHLLPRLLEASSLRELQGSGQAQVAPLAQLYLETFEAQDAYAGLFASLAADAGSRDVAAPMADDACVRAEWLAMLLERRSQAMTWLEVSAVRAREPERTAAVVDRWFDRGAAALRERPGSVLTLCTGLWVMALACADRAKDPDAVRAAELAQRLVAFEGVLRASERALQLSIELHDSHAAAAPAEQGQDLLVDALAQELCVAALAALVCGDHLADGFISSRYTERCNRVLADASARFGFDLPQCRETPDEAWRLELATRIDELLTFGALLWRRFECDWIAQQTDLRRADFWGICCARSDTDRQVLMRQANMLTPFTEQPGFTGVAAILILASLYSGTKELSGHYMSAAAARARDGQFGARLRRDLALLALYVGAADSDAPALFRELLVSDDNEPDRTVLGRYLTRLAAKELTGTAARLLRASRDDGPDALYTQVEGALQQRADELAAQGIESELPALLALNRLVQTVAHGGTINPDVVLAEWEGRASNWSYAAVLRALIAAGHATREVLQRASQALDRWPAATRWNSYFHLALEIGLRRAFGGDDGHIPTSRVVSHLTDAIDHFLPNEPVEVALRTYQALHALDPQHAPRYAQGLLKYQIIAIERDHLRRFPMLARQGRFFVVFQQYFATWRYWGLRTELPQDQLHELLAAPVAARREELARWREDGARMPAPFVQGQAGACVNSQFLILGWYLFSSPFNDDETLEADRTLFDRTAHNHLTRLVDLVGRLPSVPDFLHELLRQHNDRFRTSYIADEGWSRAERAAPDVAPPRNSLILALDPDYGSLEHVSGKETG